MLLILGTGCNNIHKTKLIQAQNGSFFNIEKFEYTFCAVFALIGKNNDQWSLLKLSAEPIKGKNNENTDVLCLDHKQNRIQPYYESALFSGSGLSFGCKHNDSNQSQFTPCNSLLSSVLIGNSVMRNTLGAALTLGKASGLLLGFNYTEINQAVSDTGFMLNAALFMSEQKQKVRELEKLKQDNLRLDQYRLAFNNLRKTIDINSFSQQYQNFDPDGLIIKANKLRVGFLKNEKAFEKQEQIRKKQIIQAKKKIQRDFNLKVQKFRKQLVVGTHTHCGLVVEYKKPVIKLQTIVGEYWLRDDQIYPPLYAACRFVNNVYQEPINKFR